MNSSSNFNSNNLITFNLLVCDYIPLIADQAMLIYIQSLENNELIDTNMMVSQNHENILDDVGIPDAINDFIFTNALSITESTVIKNCWDHHDKVNQFYHNLLTCFVHLYLSYDMTSLEQIRYLQNELLTNPDNVINILNVNHFNIMSSIQMNNKHSFEDHVLVTNAANGKFLGGVSSYGKGSAEEALCRQSDLFLRMLLENAYGDYQKNILHTLLNIFEHMLNTGSCPINTYSDAEKLSKTMLRNITKAGFEGYCIYFNAKHQGNRVHLSEHIVFTNANQLPEINDLTAPTIEDRLRFINTCKTGIHVLSIASRDTRLIGSNPIDGLFAVDTNFKTLCCDMFDISKQISNKYNSSVKLIVLPLGCGAFGNKPDDFATGFKTAMGLSLSKMEGINEINLTTFDDNYPLLVESMNTLQYCYFLDYANKGKLCTKIQGVDIFVKIQNIYHLSMQTNQQKSIGIAKDKKALVLSVSSTRKELPNHYFSKSALSAICNVVNQGITDYEKFKDEFKQGMQTNEIFESYIATELFNNRVFFQPFASKESILLNRHESLTNTYKETLIALDSVGIHSVDLTLFGTGAGGYSDDEACNALKDAILGLSFKHLKEIGIIAIDLKMMGQIYKQFPQKDTKFISSFSIKNI